MKGSIMKQLIFVAAGFGVIIALGAALNHLNSLPDSPLKTVTTSSTSSAPLPDAAAEAVRTTTAPAASIARPVNWPRRTVSKGFAKVESEQERAFRNAIETLLSPASTYDEKQSVWKKLKDMGQMDDAIAELQRRVAANPDSVEDTVTLAEAYFKKCGQINDIRQQAEFAMQADQLLDTALGVDPSNLEAQFDKVSAMAHWPLELNQGPKVLEQFQNLIQEQESQPPQPQFALSYLRLGDFYQKTGDANDAMQVWQRGAALFPENTDLQNRLSTTP
jgi:tetratricopeptide (TPR) repeat protein